MLRRCCRLVGLRTERQVSDHREVVDRGRAGTVLELLEAKRAGRDLGRMVLVGMIVSAARSSPDRHALRDISYPGNCWPRTFIVSAWRCWTTFCAALTF